MLVPREMLEQFLSVDGRVGRAGDGVETRVVNPARTPTADAADQRESVSDLRVWVEPPVGIELTT